MAINKDILKSEVEAAESAPAGTPAAAVESAEPPMADPGTTIELMSDEQRRVFLLKEHARVLIANGSLTIAQAVERNLISEADGVAFRITQADGGLSQPSAVIEPPAGPPSRAVRKRCCN